MVSSRPMGETCAKSGTDRFRNVNLCKFHTYKQTKTNKKNFIFIYKILAGVPGVARDYQSRNLMYGVIF